MIIYKITNTKNNKCYIGKTTGRVNKRFYLHKYKLNKNKHGNSHLQNSWNKYGEEAFEFEVLEECDSIEELNENEKYWIEKCGDYNIKVGGEDNKCLEKTKEKLRETHAKIRGITVHQYDLEGNYIQTFDSINQACRKTNTNKSSLVGCLKGKYKHGNFYIWTKERKKVEPRINKIYLKYSLNGKLIKKFKTPTKAAESINKKCSHIQSATKRKGKCGNFLWRTCPPKEKPPKEIEPYSHHHSKKIIQLDKEGNKINEFESIVEASKTVKCSKSNIQKVLSNKTINKTASGFKWKCKKESIL